MDLPFRLSYGGYNKVANNKIIQSTVHFGTRRQIQAWYSIQISEFIIMEKLNVKKRYFLMGNSNKTFVMFILLPLLALGHYTKAQTSKSEDEIANIIQNIISKLLVKDTSAKEHIALIDFGSAIVLRDRSTAPTNSKRTIFDSTLYRSVYSKFSNNEKGKFHALNYAPFSEILMEDILASDNILTLLENKNNYDVVFIKNPINGWESIQEINLYDNYPVGKRKPSNKERLYIPVIFFKIKSGNITRFDYLFEYDIEWKERLYYSKFKGVNKLHTQNWY